MSRAKIYWMLVGVMFAWGANVPMLKFIGTHVPPVTVTGIRILMASLAVFLILKFLKILRLPTKREWKYILVGSLTNVLLHHLFLNLGLAVTSATSGGLILGMGPILTAISAAIFLKYFPSKLQWLGLLLGISGVTIAVLVGSTGLDTNIGDLYIFISIFSQVLSYMVVVKAARTLDPRVMTAYMMGVGSIGLIVTSLILEPGGMVEFLDAPPLFWLLFLASGLISTALGHMIYNYAIGQAGATQSAIFMNLNPLFAMILSSIFLGEILTLRHIIGFLFIVAGVMLGSGAAEDLYKKQKVKRTTPVV
ncbi:EamA family transporter [Chryseomicrobium excrementi]|uniref:EamA family transporter n=1 Tax=Chryseomicrobium excrementi TaxID=2041346 RepID=A0A2M9F087_9BACL|nr:DMT family transporter [Chryseomicrobium excrementi]PJK16870.1 EamA family transporter [Chryseomicrobium excrementi]